MTRPISCVFVLLSLTGSSMAFAAAGRTVTNFDVTPSGEAAYSIPIFAPPGTNGMTPQLAIAYGHRNGGTLLGAGWGVAGLSAITRCNATWSQDAAPRDVRNDNADKFCLDGNRLRLVSGTYGQPGAEYRTEIETFTRIVSHSSAGNGPRYFIVHRRDGLIAEYGDIGDGVSADALVESVGQTSARAWGMKRLRDRSGNTITFGYAEDASNGAFRIDLIQYTSNATQGLAAAYAVDFVYETKPSNEIDSGYVAGSVIKELTRLKRVDVTHNSVLVRRYELTYEGALSSTSKSRLASVQECATVTDCLPVTTFTYQNGTPGLNGETNTGIAPASTPWLIDVDGDGRHDLVYASHATSGSGHWMVAFAAAAGGYATPINTGVVNFNHTIATPIDYNADGRKDLLVPYSGGTWWVMLGSSSGLASPSNTGTPVSGTSINNVALDVNGDGYDDLLWAELYNYAGGDAIRYRLRVPSGGFSSTVTTVVGPTAVDTKLNGLTFVPSLRKTPHRAPDFNGDARADITYSLTIRTWDDEQQRYFFQNGAFGLCIGAWSVSIGGFLLTNPLFADFNGDGKSDHFAWDGGPSFKYWLSRGTGTGSTLTGPLKGGYNTDWIIVDWDSDGYDDVLLQHTPTAKFHIMRSNGEVFSTPVDTGIAITSGTSSPAIMDVNGDGLLDIAYLAGGTWRYRTHAGSAPDVLQTATDGHGNTVTFNYGPLPSANYTKYADATFPSQDYQGPLYVVSNAVASNGIGGTFTTSYHYYGAHVDTQGRGFLGFRARRTHDSRNGLIGYEYFHRHFPYTGTVSQSDAVQPNDVTLMSRTINDWTSHPYSSVDGARYLPFIYASSRQTYEVGSAFNGAHIRAVATSTVVDSATGTTTDSTVTTTEPSTANGVQAGASYVRRTYHPSLFTDWVNWCIGRPATTQDIASHNQYGGASQTRDTSTTWDGSACRPTQMQVQPGDSTWQVTVDLGYDGYGNRNSETVTGAGMPARTTTSVWASPGSFPTSITLPVSAGTSMTLQKTWNYAQGVQASETDVNGIAVSWLYDDFGRKVQENRPDGTDTTWSYNNCAAVSSCQDANNRIVVIETQRDTADTYINDRWTYFDLFDRAYISSTRSLTGAYDRAHITFDALGRVAQRAAPAWWASPTFFWTTYQYDLIDRVSQESRPVSEVDPTIQTRYSHHEGLTTRTVDPLSKESRLVSTATGMAVRSTDHDGHYQHFDYDAFGNLLRVQDAIGATTLQSHTYNIRGMRLTSADVDRGNWAFTPNALGELVSQTDANGKTTGFTYDYQSRPLTRAIPEGAGTITSTFTWGTSSAARNIGKLEWMQISGGGFTTYRETYTFDSIGRLAQTKYTEGITDYLVDQTYNATTGFLQQLTYPVSTDGFRFKIRYDYQHGHPQRVWNFDNNNNFWVANASDARGNITNATLMEATNTTTFTQSSTFDKVTGLLQARQSTLASGTSIENHSFLWDRVGNLTQRQDNRQGLTENFYYDNLHRLDYSQLNSVTNLDVAYDARGNITSKSGVGTYTYHATKIHAVASVNTGSGTLSYSYDAVGNITNRNGTTIGWYANNLPKSITKDANNSSTFEYAPNGQRWRHVYRTSGTNYTHSYLGGLVEKVIGPTNTSWKHFVYVNGEAIAVYIRTSTGAKDRYFFVKDHLGSPAALVHGDGPIPLRESFDAFGKRRGVNWTGAPTAGDLTTANTISRRGFTFHEHLDSTDLIHMNGRVYDPVIARFVSADPFIDCWWSTQSYNRYAYVKNNPLSATDPSGFTPRGTSLPLSPGGIDNGPLMTVEVSGSRDTGAANFGFGGMGFGGGGLAGDSGAGMGGGDGAVQTVDVTGRRPSPPARPPVRLVNIAGVQDPLALTGRDRHEINEAGEAFERCFQNCMQLAKEAIVDPVSTTLGGAADAGIPGALGGAATAFLRANEHRNATANAFGAAATARFGAGLDNRATPASTVRRGRASVLGSLFSTWATVTFGEGFVGTLIGNVGNSYISSRLQATWNHQGAARAHSAGLRGVRAGVRGAATTGIVDIVGTESAKLACEGKCSRQ